MRIIEGQISPPAGKNKRGCEAGALRSKYEHGWYAEVLGRIKSIEMGLYNVESKI